VYIKPEAIPNRLAAGINFPGFPADSAVSGVLPQVRCVFL